MIHITHKEACCGCHSCYNACPIGCIEMVADNEGFLYPQVDEGLCTDCGICQKVCPMLLEPRQGKPPVAFVAWNRDAAIRAASSSGGIFSALILQTLQLKGVVFGAAFDESMTLRHQSAQTKAECNKFRGSKYLQSIIGSAYREVQVFLQQGKQVLFSGTPCQVAGLYAYLGQDEINLLTCDLVCHGVPSPKVFALYQAEMESRFGAKVQRIAFRRKDYGWKQFSLALSFDNAKEYRRNLFDDPFMIGFLRDIYLRPSCHVCPFSRLPRVADISLADFWGVGSYNPEWDDDKGTSLVLVQTEKGQKTFAECQDALLVHNVDLAMAISLNPTICSSVPPGEQRASFFHDLDQFPFEKMMMKYMEPPVLWRRMIRLARRVVGKGLRRIGLLSR